MVKGLYILGKEAFDQIYGPDERRDIAALIDIYAPHQTVVSVKEDPTVLRNVEVILSGWNAPKLDSAFLQSTPKLKAFFYSAGSIRNVVMPEAWDRGIVVATAWVANAIPVSEYAVSQILFCLKAGWFHALEARRQKQLVRAQTIHGAYGSTVGIISLGMIGRLVRERLRSFDFRVLAYDPFATAETARELDVSLCSLDEIFSRSDVLSLHTPWLPETEGMIKGRHFELMKQGASFINTARGAVVKEEEMIRVLEKRPDITAVLDVTHPEPPEPGSPLFTLPNVILTPHIAGSMGPECRRMGRYIVDELRRYLRGEPLKWQVTREKAAKMA